MVVSRGVIMLSLICIKQKHNSHLLSTICRSWNIEGGGGSLIGLIFAGYVPLPPRTPTIPHHGLFSGQL